MMTEHHGKASSFADPKDIASFKKWYAIYIQQGLSDSQAEKKAFAKGDNGIGCYGDITAEGSGPSCAIIPEDSIEKWGSLAGAKHRKVQVTANGKTVECVVKDCMPHRANVKNGAIIDLNPDAVRVLGLEPPIMITAEWHWLE